MLRFCRRRQANAHPESSAEHHDHRSSFFSTNPLCGSMNRTRKPAFAWSPIRKWHRSTFPCSYARSGPLVHVHVSLSQAEKLDCIISL